ncbi:MAG: efflux RND transporter periplasmic adaptor subunit [Balneolales bacterium]
MITCGERDSQNQRSGSGGGPGGLRGWGESGRQAVSVEVSPVSTSSISDRITSFGTIKARDVITIIPQISNRITHIYADLGDSVQQGDILARIYDVPYRDALEQARAQLRQSRVALNRDSTTFERQKLLYEREAISTSEFEEVQSAFESSRAQYESARAALTQSRENLQNAEIRSPVDGVVLNRTISVGDLARTGEPVFEVANLTGYETRLFLPMQDWEAVRIGLPVEMHLSNREDIAAEGEVSRVSPQLNPGTGLGEVVVSLTNKAPFVRQGALVEAHITLVTHDNTVVIPRSSMIEQIDTYINPETNTVEIQRNYVAFVAVGDSVAEERQLELGLEHGEQVEVLSGLEEDESLIITGQRNLSDGERIRISDRERNREPEQRLGEATEGEQRAGYNRAQGSRRSAQGRSGGNQ